MQKEYLHSGIKPDFMRMRLFSLLLIASLFLNGCDKDDDCPTITITATMVSSDGNNGRITAVASGSTGITYSLNGVSNTTGIFVNLAPGDYTVVASDANNCSGTQTFTVAGTKTFFITRNTWRFSSAFVGAVDVSGALQACQKDNIYTFVAAGTGTLDEGASKCNAGDPQTSPFTWNFLNNETQLFISSTLFTGGSSTFTVVSISLTSMVLSQIINGQTVVVTFIH
jgi:hypothetical protein